MARFGGYVDERMAEIEVITGRPPSSAVRRILEHAEECESDAGENRIQALTAAARLQTQAFELARKEAAAAKAAKALSGPMGLERLYK